MPKRLKPRIAFALCGIAMILVYQNCAQTPDKSLSSDSSYESTLPFAYKAAIDTVAYMSCSDITDATYQSRAYFTLRAGAYNQSTGGLGMTKAYLSATQYFDQTERAQALASSDYNSNALLNLSIRQAGNYQSIWHVEEINTGGAIDTFLPPLDSAQIAGPLASAPADLSTGDSAKINYFPGTEDKRLMEASLRFLTHENTASDLRNNLSLRAVYMVAGYSKTADPLELSLRSPVDVKISGTTPSPTQTAANSVFGTGYKLSFALPVGYTAGLTRVLAPSPIEEIDLSNNQSRPGNWDCSTNYEFMVVRLEDKVANRVICNAGVDRYNGSAQQAALAAVRRVLPVEDWYVDLDHHCVMAKYTHDYCYGANLGTRSIMYGQQTCVDSATTACPHFVSVCIHN